MAKKKGPQYGRQASSRPMKVAERYTHPEQTSPMRPGVGTQAQFRKKRLPKTYRDDSSLSPSMEWDGQNASRELGEWLLDLIERAARSDSDVFASPQEFRGGDGLPLVLIHSLRKPSRT